MNVLLAPFSKIPPPERSVQQLSFVLKACPVIFLLRLLIVRHGYQTTICKSKKLIILLISCVKSQRRNFFHSGGEWNGNQNQLANSFNCIKHCFIPECLSRSYSTPSQGRSSVCNFIRSLSFSPKVGMHLPQPQEFTVPCFYNTGTPEAPEVCSTWK